MTRILKIAAALVAATSAQVALAVPTPSPNAVPEPGVLGLVGVALAAAVYFSKRRK